MRFVSRECGNEDDAVEPFCLCLTSSFISLGALTFARLQHVRCWAGQAPGQACRGVIKIDSTIQAAFRHRFDDNAAEPAPSRCRHGRPLALGPAHREGVAVGSPADVYTTRVRRERAVFRGIGGKLVESEPDGCFVFAPNGTKHALCC
jgi:hypothetical protein